MSSTRGEGRAAGEKGGRMLETPEARKRRVNARRQEEERWADLAGPVEVTSFAGGAHVGAVEQYNDDGTFQTTEGNVPRRTWVCDGCMKTVTADQVADFADYEHVLCKPCAIRPVGTPVIRMGGDRDQA
jgi:hypothetical protein